MITMQKNNNKLTQRDFWPDIFQNVHKHSKEKSSAKIRLTNNINFYYYSSVGKQELNCLELPHSPNIKPSGLHKLLYMLK